MRFCWISLFLVIGAYAYSQEEHLSVTGIVQDTVAKTPLEHAVVMVVKFRDSTLIDYTRTDNKGYFMLPSLPIDTFQVYISHPQFGEHLYYVLGSKDNYTFDFGKIALPPKSHDLNEVVIYAFKDPVYYRGDTLIYTADSFKVKPNATVEDLLKKLPGIRVNAEGKITSQGKQVDQLLVDGDEFFGSDPTVATKNLNADAIESVQVYEKKSDTPSEGTADETVKVMNLKLKEEAKKGYFGRVSGGSDFTQFYEGEALANKFTPKQKISVFGLLSNTPRRSFAWRDVYEYGINDGSSSISTDDGNITYINTSPTEGIPQTFKSGFFYSNKLGKKTKLTSNYSYNSLELNSLNENNSQYFLPDTNYSTSNSSRLFQREKVHNLTSTLTTQLDSLTELILRPQIKYTVTNQNVDELNQFYTNEGALSRFTTNENSNDGEAFSLDAYAKLKRKFKKKGRELTISNTYLFNDNVSTRVLKSAETRANDLLPDSIDQLRSVLAENQSTNAKVYYVEPLTKKIKLEFSYDGFFGYSLQDNQTFDFGQESYSIVNDSLTNNFQNKRTSNSFGLKFIYEKKKQDVSVGFDLRRVSQTSVDLLNEEYFSQVIDNILLKISYRYRQNQNTFLSLGYTTNSSQPNINQLQPVADNTNPNYITIGNPDLEPTFEHKASFSYYTYKPISGKSLWGYASFNRINNGFSNSITYDSLGRTVTTPINVDGNHNANISINGTLPLFSQKLFLEFNDAVRYIKNINLINDQKNITTEFSTEVGLQVRLEIKKLDLRIGGNYSYNDPSSTINTSASRPYSSQSCVASIKIELPRKISIQTEAQYTVNTQRVQGYNINLLLWDASLEKIFLKKENLICSIQAVDLLNQNLSINRSVMDNVIVDSKTNIIGRYVLLKVIYKFNGNKQKDEPGS